MDEGQFLIGSGSKIPMPKSKEKEVAVVIPTKPVKPKLTVSAIKNTNFINDDPGPSDVKETRRMNTVKASTVSSSLKRNPVGSVPNIPQATRVLAKRRSKTFFGGQVKKPVSTRVPTKATAALGTMKRAAPEGLDVEETPAVKQTKGPQKPGFTYKATKWDAKNRLIECEEWLTALRVKYSDQEQEKTNLEEELEEYKTLKNSLDEKNLMLESKISVMQQEKIAVDYKLREMSDNYDKLHDGSKYFLVKIDKLTAIVTQKEQQCSVLQSDVTKLRDEVMTKDSSISQLRCTVDDLEFKCKRQKNQIDDLESCVDRNKKELNETQSKLRERNDLIQTLQDKLDRVERDNKFKTSNIGDLEGELMKTKGTLSELRNENVYLKENLGRTTTELTERSESERSLIVECEELKAKLCENEKQRRYLHNQVQDLKGNIRVFCRVRPAIPSEKENSSPLCSINFPDEGTLEISKGDPIIGSASNIQRPKFQKHEFVFDRVFNPSCSQEDVFTELSQLVQSALDGYNVCVFAYGQTGSGKTYTMEGRSEQSCRGMIPRTVDLIFQSLKDLELIGWAYTVEVAFLEIYNEVIRDLLRTDKEGSGLKIMQVDGKTNDVVIPGLTVTAVKSYEDLDRLYLLAHQNRAVAFTSCNERSSRSHSVTKIKVTGVHKGRGETCYGSLYLVDLAGSERLNEPMSDPRFREMKNINKSLSELGNVILGLMQKQEYIPYRNSKLTHLLQPALGGSSKTLMLVNISPAENCLQETLCSLRFAEKVNKVKMTSSKKRIQYDQSLK